MGGLLLWGGSALAAPRAGLDLGLLFREEAGGNRSVLPSFALRGAVPLLPSLELGAAYGFGFASDTLPVVSTRTLHHRLVLRGEGSVRLRDASLLLLLGPALGLSQTELSAPGESVSTHVIRPGIAGGVALDVHLPGVVLRAGVEALWWRTRTDVFIGLGAALPLGERR